MKLIEVDRRSRLSPKVFREEYLLPARPVIFTDMMEEWGATSQWSADFFKFAYGDLSVPVFNRNYSKPGKGYMSPNSMMPFREFIETTQRGHTDLRLFLFDLFKYAPELRRDFQFPTIMKGFIKGFPYMFFGGAGAEVTMHYDIDCANVFHAQFIGSKRIILFPPSESRKLYRHPFTVKSLIDPEQPDYERFPALRAVTGYQTEIHHGEMIFMPSRYWHYMHYLDFSFGLALRSHQGVRTRIPGAFNLASHYIIDRGLNALFPNLWHDWKEDRAYHHARPYEQQVQLSLI